MFTLQIYELYFINELFVRNYFNLFSLNLIMVKVFFTSRNTLLSKIITKTTGGMYTHCGFIVDDIIYEAQKDGVKPVPLDLYKSKNKTYNYIDVYTIELKLTEHQINLLINTINSKAYVTKYDVVALFKHLIYNFTGKWIKSKNPEKRMTCSEFVAFCLYIATFKQYFSYFYMMSPNDLIQFKLFKYEKTIYF